MASSASQDTRKHTALKAHLVPATADGTGQLVLPRGDERNVPEGQLICDAVHVPVPAHIREPFFVTVP